jgi:Mg-chelatase subunit ChlD
MTSNLDLYLYPNEVGFIGKLTLNTSDDVKTNGRLLTKSNISTVVILDRSGSMGNSVPRFVNQILPDIFKSLNYAANDTITLITFDSTANKYTIPVKQLASFSIKCQGQTFMAPGITLLTQFIRNDLPKDCHSLRLLTISDGEVHDQPNVQTQAAQLASLIKNNYIINSQAVRLFTSSSQPDTRAVSSLLQLNNVSNVNLLDLKTSLTNMEISATIASLFSGDSLNRHAILKSDEAILKSTPWQTQNSNSISLFPGENLFWLSQLPTGNLTVGEIKVQIHMQEGLTVDTYEKLLKSKIEYYMNQMKILKIVNTIESQKEIDDIMNYFQGIESSLLATDEDVNVLLNDSSLRARLQYLKTSIIRKKKSFVMRMSQIANDDKVSQLNSAQQAEYLRAIDNTSKNARGLARRAVTQGLDFNEILRKEVRTMAEHIQELNDIDDNDHLVSFFSQDTTLGGIRAVCQLVTDDMLDDVNANDILRMVNIVGIACSGPIGEFPDPMTWRVNELYQGCFVSLADVLTAFMQSKGQPLHTPATNKLITNVIPIIENQRIARFLQKNAPSLLEYTCSIGMRRLLADVPMTGGYTICAGVWKFIEDLNENKSELHLKTFDQLIKTYEMVVGNYFQHIIPYIKEQDDRYSYYIANNGTTNMISPLIKLYRENDPNKLQQIPKILRALYTYEIWQGIRRQYKNRDDSDLIAQKMLDQLIGLDLNKYKTTVQPLFEIEPPLNEIQFHDQVHIDQTYLDELLKTVYYVDYVTLLPKYISAVISDKTDSIKDIPAINQESICEELKINYDLNTFKFYNTFQALLYTSKASRIDSEKEMMKMIDLIDEKSAKKMVEDYIRKRFENQYATDLSIKGRLERTEITSVLVQSILQSHDHQEMVRLMREGLTRGKAQAIIANASSLGFVELKDKLLDYNEKVPRRLDIIKVLLLGRDYKQNDEPVWNNGNVLFTPNLADFERIFVSFGYANEWEKIKEEYMKRNLHIYRDGFNRHGHGNTKPSYWAYGFMTLQLYKDNTSAEIFKEYCEIHHDCCGVSQILGLLK